METKVTIMSVNTPSKDLKDMIGFEQDILNMQMLFENQSLTGLAFVSHLLQ